MYQVITRKTAYQRLVDYNYLVEERKFKKEMLEETNVASVLGAPAELFC